MNNVQLMGRFCADPVLRTFKSGAKLANFTLACKRSFVIEGQPNADFIPCIVWGKKAELICQYFSKGMRILITRGSIESSTYEKDGHKRYSLNCLVLDFEFVSNKQDSTNPPSKEVEWNKLSTDEIDWDKLSSEEVDDIYKATVAEFEKSINTK